MKSFKHFKPTTSLVIAISILIAQTSFAEGGHGSGNGGGAQFCPVPKAARLKFEAYDLYEGKNPNDGSQTLSIAEYDHHSTKENYLNRALLKIEAAHQKKLANALRRALDYLNANVIDSKDKELFEVSDVHSLMHDRNCSYYQLVNWIDQPKDLKNFDLSGESIFRDEQAYQQMDPLNQAANDLHEAAYKIRRSFGLGNDSGSVLIRKFVAQVFSDCEIDQALFSEISLYSEALIDLGPVPRGSGPGAIEQRQKIYYLQKPCQLSEFENSTQVKFSNSGEAAMRSARFDRVSDALGTREQFTVGSFGPLFGWMSGFHIQTGAAIPAQALSTALTSRYGQDKVPFLYGAASTLATTVQVKDSNGSMKIKVNSCGETFEEEVSVPLHAVDGSDRVWTSLSVSVLSPQF